MTNNNELTMGLGFKSDSPKELQLHAPSVFSVEKDPRRSDKYAFINSSDIIGVLSDYVWSIKYAEQNGTSIYSRHVIRFENEEFRKVPFCTDEVVPQLVFENSHNGVSQAQIHLGLIRKLTMSGLIVSIAGLPEAFKVRHSGQNHEDLTNFLQDIGWFYKKIGKHIGLMQHTVLKREQRDTFVIKATAAREPNRFLFDDGRVDDKKVFDAINIEEVLTPLRESDKGNSVWRVFNTIQEKYIKGEFSRNSESGRMTKVTGISDANRAIVFNKKLWKIAEDFISSTVTTP